MGMVMCKMKEKSMYNVLFCPEVLIFWGWRWWKQVFFLLLSTKLLFFKEIKPKEWRVFFLRHAMVSSSSTEDSSCPTFTSKFPYVLGNRRKKTDKVSHSQNFQGGGGGEEGRIQIVIIIWCQEEEEVCAAAVTAFFHSFLFPFSRSITEV